MRWIELNDGDLINLDAVASIVAGEKSEYAMSQKQRQ